MTDIDRRSFMSATGAAIALATLDRIAPIRLPAIRAVAFDGFALFDATAILRTAEAVVPGRWKELVAAWRSRHFQYQWLRTMGGRYADFQRTADDALATAAELLGIALSERNRRRLVDAQAVLEPWPDAVQAVDRLHKEGFRLAMLSNMTEAMLEDGLRRAGVRKAFERVLSTDRIRAAKPAPAAYALAASEFRLPKENIAFVAYASWDASGASWFGYPTAWLNKGRAVADRLDVVPRIMTSQLDEVVRWIGGV